MASARISDAVKRAFFTETFTARDVAESLASFDALCVHLARMRKAGPRVGRRDGAARGAREIRMADTRHRRPSLVPVVNWLPRYERAWLGSDLVAGVTLAAYAVPVSLAYATLAGLPPEMGLYCYLL